MILYQNRMLAHDREGDREGERHREIGGSPDIKIMSHTGIANDFGLRLIGTVSPRARPPMHNMPRFICTIIFCCCRQTTTI